ncbi:MAG: hypothetical protein RIQ94_3462 [Pseudomonadota bacterium]|jgi:hypothetical protein
MELKKQKLVSLFFGYGSGDAPTTEEHLGDLLEDGWLVKQMIPVGSVGAAAAGASASADGTYTSTSFYDSTVYTAGWVLVLLEK